MHTLIEDSLYDQEDAFAMELEFDWDLHPCFPRAGKVSRALPHIENEGVPPGLMHRDRHDDSPPPSGARPTTSRAAKRTRRRRPHPLDCADDVPGCANVTTRRGTTVSTPSTPRRGRAARDREGRPSDPYREHRVRVLVLKGRWVGGKGHHRSRSSATSRRLDHQPRRAALTAARVAHGTGAYADTLRRRGAPRLPHRHHRRRAVPASHDRRGPPRRRR